MHYLIEHETILEYPEPVREHHSELRLVPRSDEHQTVLSCFIQTEPVAEMTSYSDYYGNRVDYFCIIPPHNRLITRLKTEVETIRGNPFAFTPLIPAEQQDWLNLAVKQEPPYNDYLLHRSPVTPSAMKIANVLSCAMPRFDREQPAITSLLELMAWIPSVLEYRTGATGVHTELVTAIKLGAGVCQDFAHLFISVARSWGIPARYVMGYLDPGIIGEDEELSTHAWAEALVPGAGWIGFDATHNLLANDHYVAVAVGRDSYDAAPQRGSFKGGSTGGVPQVRVSVQQQ